MSERTICRWGAMGCLDERKLSPRTVRVTRESVERLKRAGTEKQIITSGNVLSRTAANAMYDSAPRPPPGDGESARLARARTIR